MFVDVNVTKVFDVVNRKLKASTVTADGPVFCKVTSRKSFVDPAAAVALPTVTIRPALAGAFRKGVTKCA